MLSEFQAWVELIFIRDIEFSKKHNNMNCMAIVSDKSSKENFDLALKTMQIIGKVFLFDSMNSMEPLRMFYSIF